MALTSACRDMAGVFTEFSFDNLRSSYLQKSMTPSVGEVLLLVKEEANKHDHLAVSVMKDGFHRWSCILLINIH